MKFRIDLKIFIFVILFFITKQIQLYAMIMIFAIIHEIGHLLAGILLGMKPNKMEINPFGVAINFDIKEQDYNKKIGKGNLLEIKKIFVEIAGPLTNIGIISILNMFSFINIDENAKLSIIFSNFTLAIFNLLPIYPLDGGRIIKGIIYLHKGKKTAEEYIYNISFITLIILTIISSIGLLYFKNIAIFLIIMFLWWMQIKESIVYQNRKKLYATIKKYKNSY